MNRQKLCIFWIVMAITLTFKPYNIPEHDSTTVVMASWNGGIEIRDRNKLYWKPICSQVTVKPLPIKDLQSDQ